MYSWRNRERERERERNRTPRTDEQIVEKLEREREREKERESTIECKTNGGGQSRYLSSERPRKKIRPTAARLATVHHHHHVDKQSTSP